MKKFIFAFCLFFPSILASECYAQFDLDELMETVKTEESAENSTSETSAEASAIEPTADETVSEAEDSVPQDEAEVLEKSLDNLFSDDMNAAIGTEKSEEKTDELPTSAKEDNTAKNMPTENADEHLILQNDETDIDTEDKVEIMDEEEKEDASETEATAFPTDKEATNGNTQTEETDIFADDEVDDLFGETTSSESDKDSEPQNAADILPISTENTTQTAEDDFMDDYFEDLEEQKQRDEAAYKAQKDALRLISDEPQIVTLKDEQRLSLREANQKRKEMEQQLKNAKAKQPPLVKPTAYVAEEADASEDNAKVEENEQTQENQKAETSNTPETTFTAEAPFGLRWNAGKEEIEAMGFATTPAEMENYEGVYVVRNPQQPQKTFTLVTAVFGAQNHLQAIYAQSQPKEDTPQAEKVLKLYHQYYSALKQKYGNDKEHFVPNTQTAVEEQKAIAAESNGSSVEEKAITKEDTIPTTPSDGSIGNDNFLNELKEEKAALFATFNDDNVKVTLTVLVDENAKSYITLDYENTYVIKNEQSANFDALINDL